jgi:Fe-S-cluster-containing hydrogenase component 2/CRP-like cAMP-binding protein
MPGRIVLKTPKGPLAVDCHRIIARLGAVAPRKFVESIGVEFVSPEADALPRLSPRYESTVPGLYIIGALAGYPLIKQAMNQGYEVIEYLLGNDITPSDHGILERKLRLLRFGQNVDGALAALQGRLRLFSETSALNLRELMLVSQIITPKPGRQIFTKDDYSASIYNIIQGEVHLSAGPGQTLTLRPGQFFGEMSLISGRPREVTAVAGRNCVLLESPDRAMKKLLRVEESVRNYIDRAATLRALKYFLMPYASPDTIHALSDTAQIHRVKANDPVFKEGDPVDRLYLLRSGSVTLSRQSNKQDVVVAYGAAGSYIDAMGSLSGKATRTVTARATVATEAISIDHAKFAKVMARDRQLLAKVQLERKEQVSQYTRMQAKPEAGQVLSFLMAHGVGEATNVLVIDESLCVGCDQCENACAGTHQGVSRLDRKAGPSFFSLHLPTSCRHCEHPHCMKDCPPDAIHRQVNGEVYIDDTCIGCGNCEDNCPYGVIQMAKVQPRANIFVKMGVKRPVEIAKTAVKCDMCKDLKAGPACVNACPTGAAIRIHAEEVMNLAKRRAAGLK